MQLGEVLYEERVYPGGKWACVSKGDTLYEQSISNAFMKLMRFICKENSTGTHTHTHSFLAELVVIHTFILVFLMFSVYGVTLGYFISTGRYLGMSVPIVNEFTMSGDGSNFMKEVLTAYYLPAEFQANPPEPSDPDISIIHRDTIRVIAR